MAGIQESKDVIKFVCSLVSAIAEASRDGKPTLSDAVQLLPVLKKLPAAVENISLIPEEASDYDAEELRELSDLVKEELDLPNDRVEAAVEQVIDMVVKLYALVKIKE
jgi:hypothetical protein